MISDYLVVGSGLTGAVISRLLTDAGMSVVVMDRRSHIGGNVYDQFHPSGIRIHTYGPHYFRTNDDEIWQFANRFSRFYSYEAAVKSLVDGQLENWPISASYIRRLVGETWSPSFIGQAKNFEEASLSMMPRLIYEKFVKGYSEKQWGVPAAALSPNLARRFDVRHDDEPRLMRHRYQGIPEEGYGVWMTRLLEGIPVLLNCDFLKVRHSFKPRKLTVFTGSIDEFFSFDLGPLKYRGQLREHQYLPDVTQMQPCGQVNNPGPAADSHIRTLEWKHMMPVAYARRITGTVITRETTVTATNPDDFEYPFPDAANAQLYAAYRERVRQIPKLLVCGRLGEYRYYDMDQAIARAFVLAKRITQAQKPKIEVSRTRRLKNAANAAS